jgi:hypothetical protein
MRPKPDFYPGWKMTRKQYLTYWRMLKSAHQAYNAGSVKNCGAILTFEQFRALIHARAFGRNISAKDIDRMKMFGDFIAACTATIRPDSLPAQMNIAESNTVKTRLIHRICSFPLAYVLGLLNSPRFRPKIERLAFNDEQASLEDLADLPEEVLTHIRNTLCARDPEAPAQASAAEPEPNLADDPF